MNSRFADWHPHTRSEVPAYTVTIYLAAPGTLIKTPGVEDHPSSAGHAYYSISDGREIAGYGFSPIQTGIRGPGQVVKNEHISYQLPVYARTMEITAEQHQKLSEYGQAAVRNEQTFFNLYYNGVQNSCVDFLWTGLNHAGLHAHLPTGNGQPVPASNFEGEVKVLDNIERIRSIPAPIPDSRLNKEERNPLPENRSWMQKRLTEQDQPPGPVPLLPDSLKDPGHPGHPGYQRALVAVGRMEVENGVRSGAHSEQLAAAVAARAEREGVGLSELQLKMAGKGQIQVTALAGMSPERAFAFDSGPALQQSLQQHSADWVAAPVERAQILGRDAEASQALAQLSASDRALFEHIREQVPAQLGDAHVLAATVAARQGGIGHAGELASVTVVDDRLYLMGATPGFRAMVDVGLPAPPAQESLQRSAEMDQRLVQQQVLDEQQQQAQDLAGRGQRMG